MGFWHIYMGIYGGGEAVPVADDVITTRLSILGASQERLKIIGTSQERLTIKGSSDG